MQYNKETKTLTIYCEFNEKLKDIPEDTKIIIFNDYSNFDIKVDNLPQNITHLTFVLMFNQKVDYLPQSLIHLTFGLFFNQKVDKLPQSLTYLTFGSEFNQKVDNLPKNITHLTFGWKYNKKVDNLPTNLKYLKLGWCFQNEIILSSKLKKISLTCNNNLINNIPEYIEKIYVNFDAEYDDENKKVENLPPTLKEIVINHEYYKEYIKIPFGCILTIKKINTCEII